MISENGKIEAEPTDDCYTCKYFGGNKPCTLMNALLSGVFSIPEDEYVHIANCQWYEEKKSHLKLIKE